MLPTDVRSILACNVSHISFTFRLSVVRFRSSERERGNQARQHARRQGILCCPIARYGPQHASQPQPALSMGKGTRAHRSAPSQQAQAACESCISCVRWDTTRKVVSINYVCRTVINDNQLVLQLETRVCHSHSAVIVVIDLQLGTRRLAPLPSIALGAPVHSAGGWGRTATRR